MSIRATGPTPLNKYWLSTDQETWASFSLTKLVILLLSSCICKTGFQLVHHGARVETEQHLFYLELESRKLFIMNRLDHWKLSVASEPWIGQLIKPYQHLSKALTSQAPSLGEQPRPLEPAARLWRPEYIWVVCVLLLFNRFCVFFSSLLPSSRHCSTVP